MRGCEKVVMNMCETSAKRVTEGQKLNTARMKKKPKIIIENKAVPYQWW
jgi:hypothetical protein